MFAQSLLYVALPRAPNYANRNRPALPSVRRPWPSNRFPSRGRRRHRKFIFAPAPTPKPCCCPGYLPLRLLQRNIYARDGSCTTPSSRDLWRAPSVHRPPVRHLPPVSAPPSAQRRSTRDRGLRSPYHHDLHQAP